MYVTHFVRFKLYVIHVPVVSIFVFTEHTMSAKSESNFQSDHIVCCFRLSLPLQFTILHLILRFYKVFRLCSTTLQFVSIDKRPIFLLPFYATCSNSVRERTFIEVKYLIQSCFEL